MASSRSLQLAVGLVLILAVGLAAADQDDFAQLGLIRSLAQAHWTRILLVTSGRTFPNHNN